MAKCSFCGVIIEKGTGLIYVKKDGTIYHFCSRKCEKNMIQLRRKPRATRWTVEHAKDKKAGRASTSRSRDKKKKKKAPKKKVRS